MREETMKVLKSFGGCFCMLVFAVCKLVEELVSLIKLGFFMIELGLSRLTSKLKSTADKLFEGEPTGEEIKVEMLEIT